MVSKKTSGSSGGKSASTGKKNQATGRSSSKTTSSANAKAASRSAASSASLTKAPRSKTSAQNKTSSTKAKPGSYGKSLAPSQRGNPAKREAAPGGRQATGAGGRKEVQADVVVRSFEANRGIVVLEVKGRHERYTHEKSPSHIVAMADYLRARRGFSSDQEMAEILQVHRTRLAAWKQGTEVPNTQNAQLLSYLAVVVNELEEFLDSDVIPDWLVTEQFSLGGETPVRALREGQLAEVLHAANATEHGSFV